MNQNNSIRTIPHLDPEIQIYKTQILNYIRQAESQNMNYWLLLKDDKPTSVVILGKEPVRLIAPIGTVFTMVKIIEPKESQNTFYKSAMKAVEMSNKFNAKYSYLWISSTNDEAVKGFTNAGYMEMGETYEMEAKLDSFHTPQQRLEFRKVERSELDHFLQKMKTLMSGSHDEVLSLILGNITKMPNEFLDLWYGLEDLFWVYKGEMLVGMLDLNVKESTISNIGVVPEHRNSGHGRQIMMYGLKVLKKNGSGVAHLRCHVKNDSAVHLYKSLGFKETGQTKHLIWWNHTKPEK